VTSTGQEPRSVYDHAASRRFGARGAILAIAFASLLLLLFEGPSIRHAGERMDPGWQRTMVLAVGDPAGWLGDRLPLADVAHDATAWLSPDDDLADELGFGTKRVANAGVGVPPVSPESFDPVALGEKPRPRPLQKVLVTGDSMIMPLDQDLARRLDPAGVETLREPHPGTGISKSIVVDWGKLSARQARTEKADAVVVFIGANEGFPMKVPEGGEVSCCGVAWAVEYATRVRQMMESYRRTGAARVYWLTLPTPRDPDRARIARVVNDAIGVAAYPYRAHVRLIEMGEIFTPDDRYRDAMEIDGKDTIVRRSDGIHLNDAGSELAGDAVIDAIGRDYTW
jgi:lysophospholipase L1-like esterase